MNSGRSNSTGLRSASFRDALGESSRLTRTLSRLRGGPSRAVSREPLSVPLESLKLTPFDRIKIESDRKTAHGHPLILPTPYGEFGPVFDVVALFHNAVKKQVLVAYNILEAMTRYKYEVSHAETTLFFDWFDTFEDVVLALFDVEQKVIFPFLESLNLRLPYALRDKERKAAGRKILRSLELISEKREMFQLLPAGESVPRIHQLLHHFLCCIVHYYNLQSSELPPLIQRAHISKAQEADLRIKFIAALRTKHNFSTIIPFVTHWLSSSQKRAWKSNHLSNVDSIRCEQWTRKFASTHGALPQKIYNGLLGPRKPVSESPRSAGFRRRKRTTML